jgi:FdhD protein
MVDNIIQKSLLQQFNPNGKTTKNDFLAVESPLEIRVGHFENQFSTLSITLCSPTDIGSLVVGYLFSERIIKHLSQILNIEIYKSEFGNIAEVSLVKSIEIEKHLNKRQSIMHSSCGVCGKTEFDELMMISYSRIEPLSNAISKEVITSLPQKLSTHQQGFEKTGGIHASALFDASGELLFVKEDIGRHNALDKLIGKALSKEMVPLSNHIILLSGRVSFELVHKALMAGVSTLVAIGAPSSLSVELAKSNHLNLIGFVKEDRFNLYN